MAKLIWPIKYVEDLEATGKIQRIRVPDNQGLYLQVMPKPTASGKPIKSWVFRYSRGGLPHWLTLGQFPDVSIGKAAALSGQCREWLRTGQNPHLMMKPVAVVVPKPAPAPKTVNKLLDLFEATMGELKVSTRTEYLRMLRTKVRKWVDGEGHVFGERPAVDISGEDAAALLAACRVDAPRTSAQVAIKMHQCWEYGMTLEILPDKRNIWRGQVRPKVKKKDRYLKESELVLVGVRLRACNETEDCVIAYKLFLLAGMRHRNLAHARWKWVDLEHQKMVIPTDQHKTGQKTAKPLTVYLSNHAVALLRRLKEIREADKETKGTPWLFPMRDDKKGHRDDLGDPWERIRKGQAWSDVNIHDLRRTLGSMLSALGYKGYAGEILGHAGTTVTDIYTHTASETLLRMLEEAGDRIVGLLGGTIKPGTNKLSAASLSRTGPPPVKHVASVELSVKSTGVKAARMIQEKAETGGGKSKARLFRRGGG